MPKLTFAEINQLFDLLAENFNLNELKTLCFRVGVEKLVDSSDQDNLITSLLITLELVSANNHVTSGSSPSNIFMSYSQKDDL